MPIYMDRHELDEPITQTELAMGHYQDILIQDQFGIKTLTYWGSEDGKTSFCLMDAPDAASLTKLHAASHGMVPSEVIEVDPDEVMAILGRTADPLPVGDMDTYAERAEEYGAAHDSAFRVIMFTDLKDSTLMNTQLGQDKALELLLKHNKLIRDVIKQHSGNEVKHTGDGFMLSFLNVEDGLASAFAVLAAFVDYNQQNADEAMYVRIGLAAGEPVFESNDFFGLTVNLASRLCDYSKAGYVAVSTDVCELAAETSYSFEDLGKAPLKGFVDDVQVYRVAE